MAEKLGEARRRSHPDVVARHDAENDPELVEMDGPPNPAVDAHDRMMRAVRGDTGNSLFGPVSSTVESEE